MATGGFKSGATTDFLEEWKAKREKMRAKMLGDIAAATGAPLGAAGANSPSRQPGSELSNNGNPDRGASSGNCLSSYAVARSSSGSALKRPEEDAHHPAAAALSNPKKAPPQADKAQSASPESGAMACNDSDKESASPGKGKEKKSAGPSARKGKGQIEKRKLREKRRSTGVVSMPSNESLDELDDDDAGEKDKREEEELVQANTFQNEAMTAGPSSGHSADTGQARRSDDASPDVFFQDPPQFGRKRYNVILPLETMGRQPATRPSSSAGPGPDEEKREEEEGGNGRQQDNRDSAGAEAAGLEKRIKELEMGLAKEQQENAKLLKAVKDKDELIGKLKEEMFLLNTDLDDAEDEIEQLKQENKTLLRVVGQLTR